MWAPMGHDLKLSLLVIQGTLTAQHHINDRLRPHLTPSHIILVQFYNNAIPVHTVHDTFVFELCYVEVLMGPSRPPYLSPIEHVSAVRMSVLTQCQSAGLVAGLTIVWLHFTPNDYLYPGQSGCHTVLQTSLSIWLKIAIPYSHMTYQHMQFHLISTTYIVFINDCRCRS